MLSAVIETRNEAEALARTLAALVPAAVEGLLGEVIVCQAMPSEPVRFIADHAGCRIAAGGFVAAFETARGDWFLLLEPGAVPLEGWIEAVGRHAASSDRPARFSRSRSARMPLLRKLFARPRPLECGLLLPRAEALGSFRKGWRAVARRPVVRLGAEILPAR
jgi:cellulose synthase/poly-beta-1,6-N-acetylglucosamine synthase-like glycosyltransferase